MSETYAERIQKIYLSAKEEQFKEMELKEKEEEGKRENTIKVFVDNIFDYSPELLDMIDKEIEESAKNGFAGTAIEVPYEYNLSGDFGTALARIYKQRGFKMVRIGVVGNLISMRWD